MDSRSNDLRDIWPYIFSYLNDVNIRNLGVINKYFNQIVKELKLMHRPLWYWADHTSIVDSSEVTIPAYLYKPYLLRNGDMAFGLSGEYIQFFESRSFDDDEESILPYPDWKNCQDILIFCSGRSQPVLLKGHEGAIIHIIQHDAHTLVSTGYDKTIRIWDKLSGDIKNVIDIESFEKAIYLVSLNSEELACVFKNCSVDVWNIHTGKYVKQLFHIKEQITNDYSCRRQDDLLLIEHSHKPFYTNSTNNLTVWDIKKEKIIDYVNLKKIQPQILECAQKTAKTYLSLPNNYFVPPIGENISIEIIGYKEGLLIINQQKCYYLIDTKNENTIFCFPSAQTQYKFLENGNVVILTHLPNELLIYSDYCFELKDFKVKYHTDDTNKMQSEKLTTDQYKQEYFEDRAWTILPNGNIVAYYWEMGEAKQWCLKGKEWIKDFKLEMPSIPMDLKKKCTNGEALFSLPNGNILACDSKGILAIWNGKTGQLLLNLDVTTVNNNNSELIRDLVRCYPPLPNGNLLINWRDTSSSNNRGFSFDHHRSRLLRFSIWDRVQPQDVSSASDEKENHLRLK